MGRGKYYIICINIWGNAVLSHKLCGTVDLQRDAQAPYCLSVFQKGMESMSFSFLKALPTPQEVREQFPLSARAREVKKAKDKAISEIITGESDKFLVIIGPCSADNETAVCDYVGRLARVQEKVSDRLVLVPRIYTNKPRTNGDGYKGIAIQPDPERRPDLLAGLIAMRRLQMRAIEEFGLPPADEMLYPENWGYVEDLLSYVAIGARSVEDQHHRQTASGFDVATGMKNPTSGDFSVMLNSIYAAQHPQHYAYAGSEVETSGNPLAHAILRGGVNKRGVCQPNYHYEDIKRLLELYFKMGLKNPAVIVDSNHSNSDKQYQEQVRIVKEVMHNRQLSQDIRGLVKGVMIESYIEPGKQDISEHTYGKSITDPCLGWEESERLIYDIAEMSR